MGELICSCRVNGFNAAVSADFKEDLVSIFKDNIGNNVETNKFAEKLLKEPTQLKIYAKKEFHRLILIIYGKIRVFKID